MAIDKRSVEQDSLHSLVDVEALTRLCHGESSSRLQVYSRWARRVVGSPTYVVQRAEDDCNELDLLNDVLIWILIYTTSIHSL